VSVKADDIEATDDLDAILARVGLLKMGADAVWHEGSTTYMLVDGVLYGCGSGDGGVLGQGETGR
jgi:hypothetical protein